MNLAGPTILVRRLPGLRPLRPCQCAVALLDSRGPVELRGLQLLHEAGNEGRIGRWDLEPAACRGEPGCLPGGAVALAQGRAQGAPRDFLACAAQGFDGLPDLLVG